MDNQTESSWLVGVSNSGLGTGLFAFMTDRGWEFGPSSWQTKSHSDAIGSITKALIEKINYPECIATGHKELVLAFKWVPQSLVSFDVVKTQAASCSALLCVKR